jgi:hypothetical protein
VGNEVTIIMYVMAFNLVVSGLAKALELIKDKTASKTDDKVWYWVDKLAGFSKSIVDFLSANPKH